MNVCLQELRDMDDKKRPGRGRGHGDRDDDDTEEALGVQRKLKKEHQGKPRKKRKMN